MNTVISSNGIILVCEVTLTKKQIEDLSVSISSFIYKEQNNIKNQVAKLCETAGQLVSYSEWMGVTRTSLSEQLASLYAQADDLKIWRVSPIWESNRKFYDSQPLNMIGVKARNGIHVIHVFDLR